MSRRLAAALASAALAACSAPTGKTCTQPAECGDGSTCSAGRCQVAIDTAVTSGPAAAVPSASASFEFGSTPPGASFECSLDAAGFAACPPRFVVEALGDGPHRLAVRARSAANVDATPATWSWTVDTTPPETDLTEGPTGVVIGAVSLGFSSPEAAATFECALDRGAWAPCTSPQAYPTPSLGAHTFQVRAKDALGNADGTPAERAWSTAAETTLGATPPARTASPDASFSFAASDAAAAFECRLDPEPTFTACTSPKSYAGLADGPHTFQVRAVSGGVADPTPATYTWTIDSAGPETVLDSGPSGVVAGPVSFTFSSPRAGVTFECSLDSAAFAACSSPQAYPAPAPGPHTFSVRARDALGNVDPTPAQQGWGTPPDTRLTAQPGNPVASSGATFQFSASDAAATFECRLDDAGFTPCTSPKALTALADGAHTFQVRALSAGVADPTPATWTWTVDTTGPTVNLTGRPGATQSEDPSFVFSSPEAGTTFECRLDAAASFTACTSPRSYAGLSVGAHTFSVRGRDALGNTTSPVVSYGWTQAPETTLTWAPLPWTNRTTEKVAFTASTSSATFQCQVDNAAWASCASPWSLTSLGDGAHTVKVRAVASGVPDPTEATTTFSVSTTSALLSYDFESSVTNTGLLSGYTGTLSGAATYANYFNHGPGGLQSVFFSAKDGVPITGQGQVTLTGVRSVLGHDQVASDAAYTIAFWFNEHFPANTKSAASGLLPRLFTTFNLVTPGAGLEIYHDETSTQPPPWIVCWSSGPGSPSCNNAPDTATGTGHRLIIEYGNGTSGWLNELRIYVGESADTVRTLFSTSVSGASLFGPGIGDPILGRDWWGYVDDVRIWNTTFANHWPQ